MVPVSYIGRRLACVLHPKDMFSYACVVNALLSGYLLDSCVHAKYLPVFSDLNTCLNDPWA